MRSRSLILLIDAIINLILGLILIAYTVDLAQILGIPVTEQYFYPRILGGVLLGIAIALFIEYFRKPDGIRGLGLGGAVAINLCGGFVLALFMIFGNLELPLHGIVLLWVLVFLLIMVSCVELIFYFKKP